MQVTGNINKLFVWTGLTIVVIVDILLHLDKFCVPSLCLQFSVNAQHSSPNGSYPRILPEFRGIPSSAIVSKLANAHDFSEPWMDEQLTAIHVGPSRKHRKQWEFAYLAHIVSTYGLCAEGKHGMVWAAGREVLVSYFASKGCNITASDMDATKALKNGWVTTNQHSNSKNQLWYSALIDKAIFDMKVTYRSEDMNFIPSDLTAKPAFDFIWSTCSVEHIGSITLGIRFIINAMATVKPNGIAIHTMEFTISSLNETIEEGPTVLWRKRDILRLTKDLTLLGYIVFPIDWRAGELELDQEPDLPPYKKENHIKLLLDKYVVTSFCIIVKKPSHFKH